MKKTKRASLAAAVQILSISIASIAVANPSGGKVVAGAASIHGGAGSLTVRQLSNRGIIDWAKFSIGGGEVTKFLQPGANSVLLNRVTGSVSSQLLGSLQANGRIFLINPSGILIGGGATIDTNGFVASTLDVANDEFMAGGDLKFMGSSTAKVSNLGTVNGGSGDIFLIAREVENHGTLNAPKGVVGLGAGQEVLLKSAGDERISVRPGGTGSVVNAGTVAAVQAELKANGGNMYALAVSNAGAIRATGIQQRNGRVILSAGGGTVKNSGTIAARSSTGGGAVKMAAGRGKAVNAGTLDASGKAKGQKGGRVEITGDAVELAAASLVDVSGDAGGGRALIGGDFQGKNPSVPNARKTTVAKDATIRADALGSGDGGRVIVWSDDQTLFDGAISARGGEAGGDGGFAEVSGKLTLDYRGVANLSAAAGTFGTLLLDPKNITIATGGSAARADVDQFSDNAGGDSVVDPATLAAAGASIILQATTDITFASPLTLFTSGASLTAQAGRSIFVNADIETFDGDITLLANSPGAVSNRDPGAPAITMLAGTLIDSRGGAINLTIAPGAVGDITLASVANSGIGPIIRAITVTSTGRIDAGGTGQITGPMLALRGSAIGTSALNRLNIAVGNLEAQSAGALFIAQTSGPLTIGGVDAGLSGVQVTTSAQLDLLTRNGSIFVTTPGEGILASGNVIVRAGGFLADLVLANDGFAIRSTAGSVTAIAGRDLFLGDDTRFGDVRGATSVELQAEFDVTVRSSVASTDNAAAILSVNAGAGGGGSSKVQILQSSSGRTPGLVGSGGGLVSIRNEDGGRFVNNTGGSGGVLAGSVRIRTAQIDLVSGNVSAGTTGLVEIIQFSSFGQIELGTENAGALSLTDAELDTITAGRLSISLPSIITIGAPISRPTTGPTYGVLELISGGTIFVNANVDMGSGSLVLSSGNNGGNILGSGNITALSLNAGATGGSITLDGAVRVGALTLNAPNGDIFVKGNANDIGTLDAAAFRSQFHLKDSAGGLRTAGLIDGADNSSGSIEVRGGSLVLGAGTEIIVNGFAQNFQLFSDTAFINQAGAGAITTESGGRWVIYAPSDDAAHLQRGGLLEKEIVSNVTFPTIPTNTGNTLVLGGGVVVPPSGIQQINIVRSAVLLPDDSQLDDGRILFGDTGLSGSTLTISELKLESLIGSITLQAAAGIDLTLGVDLALALSGVGSLVTLQTSLSDARITLGGNLTTGGASISLLVPAGFITTKALNVAGGDVTLRASTLQFGSISTPAGTVKLTASVGPILDSTDGATSITASKLALVAVGIGAAANPLNTSVDHLEAEAVARVFVTNTGKDLAIGGVDADLRGVQVNLTSGDAIQIVNDRSITLTAAGESVNGRKAVTLQANGGSSDLMIGNRSDLAVGGMGATVTLNAGRDLVLGVLGVFGDVLGKTVDLNAGHAAIIDEGSFVTGSAGVNVTAGTVITPPDSRQNAILIRRLTASGARLGTEGGAINLTTAAGGFIDVNSGNLTLGSIRTTLTPGVSGTVVLRADDVILFDKIDAGTGLAGFLPASATRAIDVGTNTAGQLGVTDSELNLVTAGGIIIGDFAQRTPLRVTAPITGSSYGALGLNGSDVDLIALNSSVGAAINVPALQIRATDGIAGNSAITATSLDLISDTANIFLNGPLTVGTFVATAQSTIRLLSSDNRIAALGDITRGGDLEIRNGMALEINGVIGGSNTASNVTIRTSGDITLGTGAKIVATGAGNVITLEGFNGHFINNAGNSALLATGGARYRVYSKDQLETFKRGGLSGSLYTSGDVIIGSDPLAPANVFYFQNAAAPPPAPPPPPAPSAPPALTLPEIIKLAKLVHDNQALLAELLVSGKFSTAQIDAAIAKLGGIDFLKGLAKQAGISIDGLIAALDLARSGGFEGELRPPFVPAMPRAYATLTLTRVLETWEVNADSYGALIVGWKGAQEVTDGIRNIGGGYVSFWAAETITAQVRHFEKVTDRPWKIVVPPQTHPGVNTVVAQAPWDKSRGELKVVMYDGSMVDVPAGGKILPLDDGNVMIVDRSGKYVSQGQGNIIAIGSGFVLNPSNKVTASSRTIVEKAENAANSLSVALSGGTRVFIPQQPVNFDLGGSWALRIKYGDAALGAKLSTQQILNIANIVASGGGNLSHGDIAKIVASGGGNFTPGVIAAIVAGGGGNFSIETIAAMVASGGGNLRNPEAQIAIINAGIVAGGGGNIVASGGGNFSPLMAARIVAGGGGNITPESIARIVASGGGNIVAGGGGNIVASGGGNVMTIAASIVAGGGGNLLAIASLIGMDGGSLIGMDGASLIGMDGGSLIANDGGTLIANDGGTLIANDGGTLIANDGGTLIANDGGTLIANDGGTLIANDGGTLIGIPKSGISAGAGAGMIQGLRP